MNQCQLTIPGVTYAGPGSIEKISEIIEKEGISSVLLFTDKGIRSTGLTAPIEALCADVALTVIDDLATEPSYRPDYRRRRR
jgi:alcohol dehydrogenase class IV